MADVTDNVARPPPAGTEILDLPPEVLTEICRATLAISASRPTGTGTGTGSGFRDLMNLGATCKTLNTIVRPVLYRHFDSTWLEMLELPCYSRLITPRFFKLLVCMKNSSATDLVRYADLASMTDMSSIHMWNKADRTEFREPGVDNFAQILQSLEELGLKPEFPGYLEDFDGLEANTITPLSVLVVIFMTFFRNALALRLPVDSTTNLPLLGSESSCFRPYPAHPYVCHVRDPGDTTGTELQMRSRLVRDGGRYDLQSTQGRLDLTTYLLKGNTENTPPVFPSLQELELWGVDPYLSSRVLKDQHVDYFAANAPHLRTLRLWDFFGVRVDENLQDFNLGSLTNITLLGCTLSYLDIRRLALACPKLRKFKISLSKLYRDVSVVWDGRGEFRQTYKDQHPDDESDDEDDKEDYDIEDIDYETGELYMPYSSDIVSSSLVLQALTPLAESLESIFLGKCQFVRAGYEGLNYRRRKLDFSDFNSLQTLGIWTDNLFSYQSAFLGHGRLEPADDAFSDILRDCPTIKNLHVFNTRVWPTGGTSDCQAELGIPVERALRRLSEDLMQTNSSESTETVGPSLRLVRLCHRYNEPISPGSSNLHPYPVEEGATVMGEPVTELFIRNSESDDEAEGKGDCLWGLRPPEIDNAVVERFRGTGIDLVNLRGKHSPSGPSKMERRFPYPAELDEILLDR